MYIVVRTDNLLLAMFPVSCQIDLYVRSLGRFHCFVRARMSVCVWNNNLETSDKVRMHEVKSNEQEELYSYSKRM